VAVASDSFFTQLIKKDLFGTVIDAVVTVADVPPGPGSVMAEKIGGPVISDPDTAKTSITIGAGLVKFTVKVCVALVIRIFT